MAASITRPKRNSTTKFVVQSEAPTSTEIPVVADRPPIIALYVPTVQDENPSIRGSQQSMVEKDTNLGTRKQTEVASLPAPPIPVPLKPAEVPSFTDPAPTILTTDPVVIDGESLVWLSAGRPEIVGIVEVNTDKNTRAFVELGRQAELITKDTVDLFINSLPSDIYTNVTNEVNGINKHITDFKSIKQLEKQTLADAKRAFDLTTLGEEFIQFFSDLSGYSKSQINRFSETKTLLQFVVDCYYSTISRSPGYLSETDADRQSFVSPVNIDNTFQETYLTGKDLQVELFQDEKFKDSKPLFSKLPRNNNDKIKLISNLLLKELIISSNLASETKTRPIRDYFGGSSIFEAIFGIVGQTIFETPVGQKSLASLLNFKVTDSTSILPFESKTIRQNNNNWLSGPSVFVDSITSVAVGQQYKTDDISQYSNNFTTTIRNSLNSLRSMLTWKSFSPASYVSRFFLQETTSVSKENKIVYAVLNAACSDATLNDLLFQFFTRISMYKNITMAPQTTKTLLGLSVEADRLAELIENRVFAITSVAKEAKSSSEQFKTTTDVPVGAIKNALLNCNTLETAKSAHPINALIDLTQGLNELAVASRQVDGTNKTRFNNCTQSAILWAYFQLGLMTTRSMAEKVVLSPTGKTLELVGGLTAFDPTGVLEDLAREQSIYIKFFDFLSVLDQGISSANTLIQNRFRGKVKSNSLPTTQTWLIGQNKEPVDFTKLPTTTTAQAMFIGIPVGFATQNISETNTTDSETRLVSKVEDPTKYKVKIYRVDPVYDNVVFKPVEVEVDKEHKSQTEQTLFEWVRLSSGFDFDELTFLAYPFTSSLPQTLLDAVEQAGNESLRNDVTTSRYSPVNMFYKKHELTTPKLFDRVVCVFLDDQMFEVDTEATKESQPGELQLSLALSKGLLVSDSSGVTRINSLVDSVVFCSYFVTVEAIV